MTYTSKIQRGVLIILLVITTVPFISRFIIRGYLFNELLYIQFIFTIFILGLLFMDLKLVKNEEALKYRVFLFEIMIYKRDLLPNQITQIKFLRAGWVSKGAIIQVKKGLNVRVINFQPSNVYDDLIHFAIEKEISIFKSKDFLILEK